MKKLVLFILLNVALPFGYAAMAADSAPPVPTVKDLQAQVADLNAQVAALKTAVQTAIAQRTAAENAVIDSAYSTAYTAAKSIPAPSK